VLQLRELRDERAREAARILGAVCLRQACKMFWVGGSAGVEGRPANVR